MKFLVTEESARLARWLRLFGYDAALMPAEPLPPLICRAFNEQRVVITRNRRVGTSCLLRIIQLGSNGLDAQLRQLMREVPLPADEERPFSRCDRCNVTLEPAAKAEVLGAIPPYVAKTKERFHRCPSCRRVYWAATHCDRIRERLARAQRGGGDA